MSPVAGERNPGVPTPTVQREPATASSPLTRFASALRTAS